MRMNIPFRRVGRVGIGLCEIVVLTQVSRVLTAAGYCKIHFSNTGEGLFCLPLSCFNDLFYNFVV